MAFELITGRAGRDHVTSDDVGTQNALLFGDGRYILDGLQVEVVDSNTLHVSAFNALVDGRHFRCSSDGVDLKIANGIQNHSRIDLVVMRYELETSGQDYVESGTLAVIQGESVTGGATAPDYATGSILAGDRLVEVPLFTVPINGISVGNPSACMLPVYHLPIVLGGTGRSDGKAVNVTGVVGTSNGGTGANNARGAAASLLVPSLVGSTSLGANIDLNTVVKFGTYYCAASDTVKTWKNCPTTYALRMTVANGTGMSYDAAKLTGNYLVQEIVDLYANVYRRCSTTSGSTWSAWSRSVMSTDVIDRAHGGTGKNITSDPSMLVNLGSTSAASVFQSSPRPGVTGTLPTSNGGTGRTDGKASNVTGTVAVENGGTGATTAATARTKLGAAASSHNHSAANITSGTLPTARGGTGSSTYPAILSKHDDVSCRVSDIKWGGSSGGDGKPYIHVGFGDGSSYGVTCWQSDERVKDDIADSDIDALSAIDSIAHRSFTMRGANYAVGYIAQELERIDPNLILRVPMMRDVGERDVWTGDYAYQIDERSLVPYLSKAIQELSAKVSALEGQINYMKGVA